jgi:hypothetical protein
MIMVDEFRRWGPNQPRPFHRGSCHLTVAGSTPEDIEALHEFAASIGLKREWFQGGRVPHYDLTASVRRRALVAGAVFISSKDQARARLRGAGA